ncbi:MAG: folate-binding protein [Actinomycetia bacterium]|nr:folate-binding protein [Actinomycetes bacterium]
MTASENPTDDPSDGTPNGQPKRDVGVAWHLGSPFIEQGELARGAALVDLSHLGVIVVDGVDRLTWLHDLTTAYLTDLPAGDSRMALILDQNGHALHELHIVAGADRCWLIVEADEKQAVLDYLNAMRFMLRVEVHDVSETTAVVAGAPAAAPAGTLAHWQMPGEFAGTGVTPAGIDAGGGAQKYVPERPGVFPIDQWIIARSQLDEVLAGSESVAGTWAWEALRVAAGVPRVAADADPKSLPHELGLIGPGVHLAKGCYRGQEAVARTHNMGRPPRRLVQLLLSDSETPVAPGAEVFLADRKVGQITSVTNHYENGPLALATIKRRVDPTAELTVAGTPASQVPIVFAG